MAHIRKVDRDTLSVDVEEMPPIFTPKVDKIIARQELGKVILFILGSRIELNTVTAHKIGYSMAMAKLAPNEMIVLTINREKIELPGQLRMQVATAILRKADDADDWQLKHRRKRA